MTRTATRPAARLAAALAALLLAVGTGCSDILAEIDSAHELAGTSKPAEKPEQTAKADGEEPKKGIDWTTSRSINSGQVDASIVRCSLDGSTQFMKRDDCITRGGSPDGV